MGEIPKAEDFIVKDKTEEDKQMGYMEKMMQKMYQRNMPKCGLCKQMIMGIASLNYNTKQGEPMIICINCVTRAITFYIENRK